jgi:hypothetical protein
MAPMRHPLASQRQTIQRSCTQPAPLAARLWQVGQNQSSLTFSSPLQPGRLQSQQLAQGTVNGYHVLTSPWQTRCQCACKHSHEQFSERRQ